MGYSPTTIANTFLQLHRPVDPMKMQKLVYFAHGWHLGLERGPLINEPIEAWDYGPVVASLYGRLKSYGSGEITEPVRELVVESGGLRYREPKLSDPDETAFLNQIVRVYGKLSALQLSEMTHLPNTPWSKTRELYPGVRGAVIDDQLMATYFKQLAQANAARHTAARA